MPKYFQTLLIQDYHIIFTMTLQAYEFQWQHGHYYNIL